ncbi:hypothetical protein RchiOBHm_Chr3g0487661 [Rosa chinensis]|uniref:Uncharacterized protein n=1 Tax=Rosa chinensis TaxID=74649 RepID=A0A2P6RFL2_ROSCH|nr:hypothetical protein RchiOBHm_Chr3g0487661 [Rosa chinensis]
MLNIGVVCGNRYKMSCHMPLPFMHATLLVLPYAAFLLPGTCFAFPCLTLPYNMP